jgi:hypothetical protein
MTLIYSPHPCLRRERPLFANLSFGHFTAADTARAYNHGLFPVFDDDLYPLEVRFPGAASFIVRMAYVIAITCMFSAYFTVHSHIHPSFII